MVVHYICVHCNQATLEIGWNIFNKAESNNVKMFSFHFLHMLESKEGTEEYADIS